MTVTDTGQPACDIYANGLNRISVTVFINPIDADHNSVEVDPKHLAANTWLINYATQAKLNRDGSSGWCYTDTPNQFGAIPNPSTTHEAKGDGYEVTFYIYCTPDAPSDQEIGVLVHTDTGKDVYNSDSGDWHTPVTFTALPTFTYKKGDITWDHEPAKVTSGWCLAHHFYLTCAKTGHHFVTFSVDGYCTGDPNLDGLMGWQLTGVAQDRPGMKTYQYFYGAYAWWREPHTRKDNQRVSYFYAPDPYDDPFWDELEIYNKSSIENERSLSCTWICHQAQDADIPYTPNGGEMTEDHHSYSPKIVAYDSYGNSGDFWPDAENLVPDQGEGPKLDIYDYNPHP
ncbi:hypothetical protein [Kitasatospora sp. NPDC005856]|uniref:hypothetical protein n=1 Tax=Kitasatospora sp. NPDC005856 TaxID=3154566 RepID=UPI0033DA7E33